MKSRKEEPRITKLSPPGPWNWTLLFCLLSPVFSPLTFAQNYAIDWFKIGGGGGASAGGLYTVSGTIGQQDAGSSMSGGSYALTGGFWSPLSVVQTPGAPLLSISRASPNTAMIYWPSTSAGFQLQQNATLGNTNWITPPEPLNDDGTRKYILVSPPVGQRFYRLFKP